eukprot:4497899-Prymnesium_polylepis.2
MAIDLPFFRAASDEISNGCNTQEEASGSTPCQAHVCVRVGRASRHATLNHLRQPSARVHLPHSDAVSMERALPRCGRPHLLNPRAEYHVTDHAQHRLTAVGGRLGEQVDHLVPLHLDQSRLEDQLHILPLLELLLTAKELRTDAGHQPVEL